MANDKKLINIISTKKLFIVILLSLLLILSLLFIRDDLLESDNNVVKEEVEKKIYQFIEFGNVINDADIYLNNNGEYKKIGIISKGVDLEFSEIKDNYLLIKGFDKEYYVDIENIEKTDRIEESDERYKRYIVFNENIVTNDETNFYDESGNLLYKFNFSYDLPIIVKDNDRYGVEFNNQLLYVNESDVKNIKVANNTDKKNSSGVGVLNYHFFYDESNQEEKNECNQIICQSTTQFQSELDYLKENNILTITTKELEWYIDGKVNLPKSVLITIDDGWMMNRGIELLEKNEMYGCVFLITSWFDDVYFKDDFKYIEFNSHGEKLHDVGTCPGGQGGGIKCLAKDRLLEDLKISSEKLGGSKVFAYPFYEYNSYSIEILKEAGYTMAFAGETTSSDNLVHVGSNKYELPRFVMVNYTTKDDLDRYFNNIK